MPPFVYGAEDDEEYLAGLNNTINAELSQEAPLGPPRNPMYADDPAGTQAAVAEYEAKHAIDDTEHSLAQGFGVPGQTPNPLKLPGYEAKRADLLEQQQRSEKNALDLLQKALNNKLEVSPSQGLAAALLAAIPALGGIGIGKMVKNPKIPEGVYFPGMDGKEFKDMFGVGGNAAAAEGARIGNAASQDYLGRMEKEALSKTPIMKDMAEIETRRAAQMEGRIASLDQAELAQQATAERQRERQQFAGEQRQQQNEFMAGLIGAKHPERAGLSAEQVTRNERLKNNQDPDTGEQLPELPAETRGKINETEAIRSQIAYGIDKLKSVKMNYGSWQAARFSVADMNFIRATKDAIVDIGRFKSGAVIPPKELANIEKFVAGDITANPDLVIKALTNYYNYMGTRSKSYLSTAGNLTSAAGRAQIGAPMQQGTGPEETTQDRLARIRGGGR